MKSNKQAFTLIELLVVVLIIGILTAVALPQYQKAVMKSRITQVIPWIRAVYEAQKVYFLSNGKYAESIKELDVDYICPEGWTCFMGTNEGTGKFPKVEAVRIDMRLSVVLYYGYGSVNLGSKNRENKLYCWASARDARAVSICRLFGPVFGTDSTGVRVLIQ